jgi:hypothetical protein
MRHKKADITVGLFVGHCFGAGAGAVAGRWRRTPARTVSVPDRRTGSALAQLVRRHRLLVCRQRVRIDRRRRSGAVLTFGIRGRFGPLRAFDGALGLFGQDDDVDAAVDRVERIFRSNSADEA